MGTVMSMSMIATRRLTTAVSSMNVQTTHRTENARLAASLAITYNVQDVLKAGLDVGQLLMLNMLEPVLQILHLERTVELFTVRCTLRCLMETGSAPVLTQVLLRLKRVKLVLWCPDHVFGGMITCKDDTTWD